MSAVTNLGKCSVTPKGAWANTNTYEMLDIVTSGGSSYLAKQDVPTGVPLSNTSYWIMIAEKGDGGEVTSASASISGGYGTPGVTVTAGGTAHERTLAFAFTNLRGEKGETGNGIDSVYKTGTSGLVDTYTILFTDGSTYEFEVNNGTASIDDTLSIAGRAADANATGLGCARQIIRYGGYVKAGGLVRTDDLTRHYTNLIPCAAGEVITYQAETNHSSVNAITVYDAYQAVIAEVRNIGDNNTDHTYTTPLNTAFVRFSFAGGQYGKVIFTNPVVTNQVIENALKLGTVSEITTQLSATTAAGKYVDFFGLGIGDDWTTKLANNSGSTYTTTAVDVSAFIGKKLKISMTNYGSTSTRALGFCDSDNLVSSKFSESPNSSGGAAGFVLEGGKYVTYLEITDTHFFLTVSSNSNVVTLEVVDDTFLKRAKKDFYTKTEIDQKFSGGVYVDGVNGSDTNAGTAAAPLKTIQAGVNAGVETVYVVPGTYSEQVNISNRNGLRIVPKAYGTYSSAVPDTPKIVIDGDETLATGITITDSTGIQLTNFELKDFTTRGMYITNSKDIDVDNCVASGCWTGGFVMVNTCALFRDCLAYNIGHEGVQHPDGFNIHGYGNTDFIHCSAHDCGDDGISHHDGCTGHIIGGEYYNCGKGGVASPTHGAYIDVDGVYSHDNAYGLYAHNDSDRTVKGRISNCVFKNNSTRDIDIADGELIGWNNIYDTKSVAAGSTFTEFAN